MRRWLTIGCLLPALAAGCATKANYRDVVASWVGASADDLVRAWGAPQSTYRLDSGNEILVWEDTHASTMPTTVMPGNTTVLRRNGLITAHSTPTTVSGGGTVVYTCRTEFEVNPSGQVVRWRAEGENCVAGNPERDGRFRGRR
jgi:hypothetical protein